MALVVARSTFARVSGVGTLLGRQSHPLNSAKMAAVAPIQVATLKATYGGKYPYYPKPWPKDRVYTVFHEFFDRTDKRMNENSKLIIVEGNAAVGKNEFAKKFAHNFDLHYIESKQDEDIYKPEGEYFDLRDLNEVLPAECAFNDLKLFYSDEALARSGQIGRLQLNWYYQKYQDYCDALHHIFCTGQGVVLVRSPYSDNVYLEAMKQLGYVSRNFARYYNDVRDSTLCELLKPHLTIYLDAPVSTIRERVQQRGVAHEQNSKVFTDAYLEAIESTFKNRFLPKMRESGEVLEIDWKEKADEMDMEVIIEECQRLRLEAEDHEDTRCADWFEKSEDMLCSYRKRFGSAQHRNYFFHRPMPLDCPEIMFPEESIDLYDRLVYNHPAIKYRAGWAPEFGHNRLFM